jgi:glycosyltransferase involved in cell wall biosynthesis
VECFVIKVASVHDWLIHQGGAEKVLKEILKIYPSDVYTLVADPNRLQGTAFEDQKIHTSFIQKLPRAKTSYRTYLPLFPLAIEQFDLSGYDLIVSSSHAVAKGVLTSSDQLHICYCHTPMRYAWDLYHQYLEEAKLTRGIKGGIARLCLHYLRLWDQMAANRVDIYVANSSYVKRRIEKLYGQKATVIHPPVEVDRFEVCEQKEDYYVTASRLVPYKKIEMIVRAFSHLKGRRLIVIGDGPDLEKIKKVAGSNVEILGRQSDETLKEYLQQGKAFVFAAVEDFGILPVEAQACGTPVIAYGKGGVLETVIEGKTGLFYESQTEEALVKAIEKFEADQSSFIPKEIRDHAEQFRVERFHKEFEHLVQKSYDHFLQRGRG